MRPGVNRQCVVSCIVVSLATSLVWAGTDYSLTWWREQAETILAREWAVVATPEWVSGIPTVTVTPEDSVNAYAVRRASEAEGDRYRPEVVVCWGLIEKFVENDVDALACIIGHELAHIVLGHHTREVIATGARLKGQDQVIGSGVTREAEIECDILGMKIAGKAGYDPNGLIRAFQRGREKLGENSFWEALSANHPTFTERLAVIDERRRELWQSVLDFEVGVDLLRVGNYECAALCFRSALERFPDSAEVHCNSGYALLCQYYQLLPTDYWAKLCPGQPLPVGYETYLSVPASRRRAGVGMSELRNLWMEGVSHLERAQELDPDLPSALGNLGFAYLVAPDGPEPQKALKYFNNASKGARKVPASQSIAIDHDAALALWISGRSDEAAKLLEDVEKRASRSGDPLVAVMATLNWCILHAASHSIRDQEKAFTRLPEVLKSLPYGSAEWEYGYEQYRNLGGKLGRRPLPASEVSPPEPVKITAYLVYGSLKTFLGDRMPRIAASLGSPFAVIPVALKRGEKSSLMHSWRYPEQGLELVFFGDRLIRGKVAPSSGRADAYLLVLANGRPIGELRIGDDVSHLERLLPRFDAAVRLGDSKPYRLYSDAGIAVRSSEGKIAALAIVRGGAGELL